MGVRCYRVGVLTPTERCRPLVMRDTAQCPMVPAHWRQHTGHCSSAAHPPSCTPPLHSSAVTALNNSKNDSKDKQIKGKYNAQMHIYLSNLEDDIGRCKSLFFPSVSSLHHLQLLLCTVFMFHVSHVMNRNNVLQTCCIIASFQYNQ